MLTHATDLPAVFMQAIKTGFYTDSRAAVWAEFGRRGSAALQPGNARSDSLAVTGLHRGAARTPRRQ